MLIKENVNILLLIGMSFPPRLLARVLIPPTLSFQYTISPVTFLPSRLLNLNTPISLPFSVMLKLCPHTPSA